MKTILDEIPLSAVVNDPFPHIVIEGILEENLCEQLIKELPSLSILTHRKPQGSNVRFDFTVSDERREKVLSPLWRDFLEAQASPEFFRQFVRLFGPSIKKLYPELLERFGPLESWKVGNRFLDSHDSKDILLDAHIGTNTPTITRPSSVREVHVDDPKKLYGALLYLRLPEDNSEGSDLILYRYRNPKKKKFFGQGISSRYVEMVKKVPYKKNTLIFFLNGVDSLHGVSPRQVGPSSRHFVNLIAEMKEPIFDLESLQENIWLRRVKTFINTHFKEAHA